MYMILKKARKLTQSRQSAAQRVASSQCCQGQRMQPRHRVTRKRTGGHPHCGKKKKQARSPSDGGCAS